MQQNAVLACLDGWGPRHQEAAHQVGKNASSGNHTYSTTSHQLPTMMSATNTWMLLCAHELVHCAAAAARAGGPPHRIAQHHTDVHMHEPQQCYHVRLRSWRRSSNNAKREPRAIRVHHALFKNRPQLEAQPGSTDSSNGRLPPSHRAQW
jgi:hypothetical protein